MGWSRGKGKGKTVFFFNPGFLLCLLIKPRGGGGVRVGGVRVKVKLFFFSPGFL